MYVRCTIGDGRDQQKRKAAATAAAAASVAVVGSSSLGKPFKVSVAVDHHDYSSSSSEKVGR